MDRPSGKRVAGGLVIPGKVNGAAPEVDQNAQFCNRIGCAGRIKCGQNGRIGNSDKSKCSKSSLGSSRSNEMTGKPSRSSSVITSPKKPSFNSKRKTYTRVKSDQSDRNLCSESEAPERNRSGYRSESIKSKEIIMTKAGSSTVSSSRIISHRKSRLPGTSASSVPSTSRSSALGPYNRSNGSKSSLRNLKCNSISDVVPPSCLPLQSESAGKNTTRTRSSEGESSLSRKERKITPPSSMDRRNSLTTSGISISDTSRSSSASLEDSNHTSSTWVQRSVNLDTRITLHSPQTGRNSLSLRESALSSSSQIHDNGRPFSCSRSYRDNPSSRMLFSSSEPGLSHIVNHDVLHRYNMDDIAELLTLALERIGEDGELTNEQILALGNSLFISGLNLHDQHRDMRLDINNMSYEELLALEEKMGTVSTALSAEALSRCLKRSVYQTTPSNVQITGSSSEDGDGTKCSICQEEYVNGDEIGKLVQCQHGYHATCITQWLQLKNWCPICKASAALLQ